MIPYSIIENTKRYVSAGKDWLEFQHSLKCGDCERVATRAVNAIRSMGIPAAKLATGLIKYPVPVISNDLHEAETYELRHWWVVIFDDVYEFGKGTLVNGVTFPYGNFEISDMESVEKPEGFEYRLERFS